jgi:putative transposase
MFLLCWIIAWLLHGLKHLWQRSQQGESPRYHGGRRREATSPPVRTRAKPAWVREEIIVLAAYGSTLSCRKLADTFNGRHAAEEMTVGHDLVWRTLRDHQADIRLQRQRLKRRAHRSGKPNHVWGMDGTGKTDEQNRLHFLLGIVDHGTRRCLTLETLPDKASTTILRALLATIDRYGKPMAIRTDNEAIFNSRLVRFALAWLGIRHQTTERHCPWQNGRIERFFGTLKQKLDQWTVPDCLALKASLDLFVAWYNHVRPHQHLQGMTPADAWNGIDIRRRPVRRRIWFEAWDGLLQGEYQQR